jgi:hypothetical protein
MIDPRVWGKEGEMKQIGPRAGVLAAMRVLGGCVAPPVAPTIAVAPGPNKGPEAFGSDQAACQQYASAQIAPAAAAANNQAAGSALLGTALGAGLGAGIGAAAGNAGRGAAIGAASGGTLGIIGNAAATPYAQGSLQQQFDMVYAQCMAAHGNQVPGLLPPPGTRPYPGGPAAAPYGYPGAPAPYGAPSYPGAPVPPPPSY